jgi:hypothetical protein
LLSTRKPVSGPFPGNPVDREARLDAGAEKTTTNQETVE